MADGWLKIGRKMRSKLFVTQTFCISKIKHKNQKKALSCLIVGQYLYHTIINSKNINDKNCSLNLGLTKEKKSTEVTKNCDGIKLGPILQKLRHF